MTQKSGLCGRMSSTTRVAFALLATLAVLLVFRSAVDSTAIRGSRASGRGDNEHRTQGKLAPVRLASAHHGHHFFAPATAAEALPHVLIATPVKNSADAIPRYLQLLEKLDYPPEKLSIAILDSDSSDKPSEADKATVHSLEKEGYFSSLGFATDSLHWKHSGTLFALLASLPRMRQRFLGGVTILQHNFKDRSGGALSASEANVFSLGAESFGGDRHAITYQSWRRAALARSRNHLLISALESSHAAEVDFVLWVDVDVQDYSSDVLRRLLATGKEIIVPNVVLKKGGRSFDLNSWRATEPAKVPAVINAFGNKLKDEYTLPAPGDEATSDQVRRYHDAVLSNPRSNTFRYSLELEGYVEFDFLQHRYLYQYRSNATELSTKVKEDKVIRLDGVGGAMLLVNAELHRHGLIFPPFPYRKRIETEGLAMMALEMGVLSYGLPDVEVIHH